MQSPFIPEDKIADAKLSYAEALRAYRLQNPFDKEAPFKAALMVWPEDMGQLPIALWAVHGQQWFNDPDVLAYIDAMNEEAAAVVAQERKAKVEYVKSDEFKDELRYEMIEMLRLLMKTAADPEVKLKAQAQLAKLRNVDEKPAVADPDAGRVLGIIQHELRPVDAAGVVVPFADRVRDQQRRLQVEVAAYELELDAGENARLVN